MKNVLISLLIGAMVLFAGQVCAQEKGPLSLSLRGNVINSDIFSDSDDFEPTEHNQTGFGLGVAAEYDGLPYDLSLEAAIDRFNLFDENPKEFNSTDFSLSLKYNFKQFEDKQIIPYVLGGVGYMVNDYSVSNVDNSLETHIGAGLNYLIDDSWTLYAEGRYLWSEADFSDSSQKIDLNSFIAMTGLKYRF